MSADTLAPDLIDEADRMADWAVDHAAEAGQHPTLPTVAEARLKFDCPLTQRRHDEATAHVQRIAAEQHRSRVAQALALYRKVQGMA